MAIVNIAVGILSHRKERQRMKSDKFTIIDSYVKKKINVVLDKIRIEMANLDNLNPTYLSDGRYTIDKTKVLGIIDKYKIESEDEE